MVTMAALAVVAVVLLIYIIQNPSTYRQASDRLTVVAAVLRNSEASLAYLTSAELQARIQQVSQNYNVRIIFFNRKRGVVLDSQPAQPGTLSMPLLPRLRVSSVMRDSNGISWLYIIQHLNNGGWLMLAVPRPSVPLLAILSDELMLPVLGAGIVALIISLLVAFWLARWIGEPLQRVVMASHRLPANQAQPIPLHGPHEVQELTRAFNEMNTRVQTSQRSQRNFVANVSHELKTPLTSIQGFAQALLDGTADTPQARQQAARVIFNEAGSMHRMVLDLLDLARLDAGTLDLQRAPVDLVALLNTIAERFTPQAHSAGVTISVEPASIPAITGDGDRLGQAFSNLVDNALKNTPAGGNITLRTSLTTPTAVVKAGSERSRAADTVVQVDVMDTGVGISSEALPHIFDRFFQADPSRSGGDQHGTGLGLAIVKEIVEAHGGKIDVRSMPNSGSAFTILLPLATAHPSTTIKRKK